MKKFLLSIVLMAMVSLRASAYSLELNISGMKFYDGSLLDIDTTYVYLIQNPTWTPFYISDEPKEWKPWSNVLRECWNMGDGCIYTQSRLNDSGISVTLDDFGMTFEDGDEYAVVVRHYNQDDSVSYYNATVTKRAEFNGDQVFSLNFDENDFKNTRSDRSMFVQNDGWYVGGVPEPATGALALAGVALLFRRRRQA